MRFEAVIEKEFSHPVRKVWAALTEAAAISQWLMETRDFTAEIGQQFTMVCERDDGVEDVYHCEVLTLEPPRLMVWSWVLAGCEDQGVTRVTFELTEMTNGTLLRLRHSGDRDRDTIERFKEGWPAKLETLREVLRQS